MTRNDKFRCCKLLQDVKSCIIAQGEAIRTSIDVENITLGTKENSQNNAKNPKISPYIIDGNGVKHPLFSKKTDVQQPEMVEEELNFEKELENVTID